MNQEPRTKRTENKRNKQTVLCFALYALRLCLLASSRAFQHFSLLFMPRIDEVVIALRYWVRLHRAFLQILRLCVFASLRFRPFCIFAFSHVSQRAIQILYSETTMHNTPHQPPTYQSSRRSMSPCLRVSVSSDLRLSRSPYYLITLSLLIICGLLLACAAPMALPIVSGPRWACPSPQPLPWGEAGPIKDEHVAATANPTSGVPEQVEASYYAEWEQEYGEGGTRLEDLPAYRGPPFPSPTPYGRTGNTYMLGQRVEIAPLHMIAQASAAKRTEDGNQIYLIDLIFTNPTSSEVPFTPQTQVWLRTITRADGTQQTGDGWRINAEEATRRGLSLPSAIPIGESHFRLPIIASAGTPHVVEVRFPIQFVVPTSATGQSTPTPNAELRNPDQRLLTVQWVNAQPFGPLCNDPGALTDWSLGDDPKAVPRDGIVGLKAPPGAPRVVAIALAQVGKQYVWGASGPERFDCSGLMQWSYAQIGIRIPRSTATQWPGLRAISLNQMHPGDLVFFDTRTGVHTPSQITHVGMVADVNADGQWDLIHAASPHVGVRVDYTFLTSSYYASRLFGEARTVR